MWCIPSSYTQDDAGATVYVGEKKDALIVYLVEKFDAKYNVDSVLNGLHHSVWLWWRNDAFGISVQEFLDAVEHLNVASCPFQQALPKIVKAGVRNRREGIYLPEHTITLCIKHLQAIPLPDVGHRHGRIPVATGTASSEGTIVVDTVYSGSSGFAVSRTDQGWAEFVGPTLL